jgi:hypothetical protein
LQGTAIEGSLLEDRIDQFKDKLKEGRVYKLESFMTFSQMPYLPHPNERCTYSYGQTNSKYQINNCILWMHILKGSSSMQVQAEG